GTPTSLWFTPKYTTKQMKEETGDPNFDYEISCDQMCGNGHYGMRGVIKVVTQAEFDAWMAGQKSAYATNYAPAETPAPVPAADTTHKVAALVKK
ncbi:MAG TPA: hypothetical protein VHB48_14830, partial [Chitinophagaceae bacterium]|nr:hypothetical protein [Chitinophagaceae bacterium]